MDCDDITGVGTPDEERSGLGIEIGRGQRSRGEIGSRSDPAAVGILTPQGEHRPGIDREYGLESTEGEAVLMPSPLSLCARCAPGLRSVIVASRRVRQGRSGSVNLCLTDRFLLASAI